MITVPDNTIAVFSIDDYYTQYDEVFQSLLGKNKRDWFVKHAYFCLPLVIGNQYGFAMKSLHDFSVYWNGGPSREDVKVEFFDQDKRGLQNISSHFGMRTITITTPFHFRTPPMVNLMTINVPNAPLDGLSAMTGVIECDNLRRDFSFNIAITRPGVTFHVKKGDLLCGFIPYPRNFVENFKLVSSTELYTPEQIKEERECGKKFGELRTGPDKEKPHHNGRLYFEGVDAFGNKFENMHQKNLTSHRK